MTQPLAKLTSEQCQAVLDWVGARLRSVSDVLAELERPEVLAFLDSIGAVHLDPAAKTLATGVSLQVGGSNAAMSWKATPSYKDVDVFFVIADATSLTDQQVSDVKAICNRRLTDEILVQRDGCTIAGLEDRFIDIGKVGVVYGGMIWPVPGRCQHCKRMFNDGKFSVVNDVIFHEGCLG